MLEALNEWNAERARLETKIRELEAERDLLLVICRHATQLIDNQGNCTAQSYAIVNSLSNAINGWKRGRPNQPAEGDQP